MEDLKGQLSARALMQSLHTRVSELTLQLRTEQSQHIQVSEKLEKYKADNKTEMVAMEKRLRTEFMVLYFDKENKVREAERLRDEALGPNFDFKKECDRLAEDYSNCLLEKREGD